MEAKRIGLVGFDGVAALDLVGPAEAFANTLVDGGDGSARRAYEVLILGPTRQRFASESGVVFTPQTTFRAAPPLDTLIVPGGSGLRRPETASRVSTWIASRAAHTRRVASVCTGIFGLAPTGLLDGRRVTTHWRFAADVAKLHPSLRVDANALYVRDGRFYTSAGITAAIDLALALIEEDHGPRVALSVARELVVYLKRPGGQEQFSEPLRFQTEAADDFADLAAWIVAHPGHDLSVAALAARACLCPRHFSRRFKEAFGRTPAAFVNGVRLGEARRRLSTTSQSVDGVAASVGFNSADAFRRAFAREYGIKPSSYRSRFAARVAP